MKGLRVYDENSNPRHLQSVSPEALDEQEAALALLDDRIDKLRKMAGVFQHGGWKFVIDDLVKLWQTIDAQIRSRKADSMQDVEYMRGQLNALEYLFGLPDRTTHTYEDAMRRFQELQAQLESAPHA